MFQAWAWKLSVKRTPSPNGKHFGVTHCHVMGQSTHAMRLVAHNSDFDSPALAVHLPLGRKPKLHVAPVGAAVLSPELVGANAGMEPLFEAIRRRV
jgi:hypothetical protein